MNLFDNISGRLPYYGTDEKVINDEDQDTNGIIDYVKICHKEEQKEYDEIAGEFWRGNAKDTASDLFKFLKQHVTYRVEPEKFQSVKTPGVIMAHGYGDCKHYALFINGVCDALNRSGKPIACKYRFVADNPDTEVHHVFAVVNDGSKEYWVDPVISRFNERPNFYNIKDYKMAVHYLRGTSNFNDLAQVGLSINVKKFVKGMQTNVANLGKGAKVDASNIKKGITQAAHGVAVDAANTGKGIAIDANKAKTAVLSVAGLPMRKAFLSLVALNVLSFATDLDAHLNDKSLRDKWESMGGNFDTLKQAISNGKKRPRIGCVIGIVGVDDAAIAGWMALASAAIALLGTFLKSGSKAKTLDLQATGASNILAAAYQAASGNTDEGGLLNTLQTMNPNGADGKAAIFNNATPTPTMAISTGVTSDGSPQVIVHDATHPAMDLATSNADTPEEIQKAITDVQDTDQAKNDISQAASSTIHSVLEKIENFVIENKVAVAFAGVGIVMFKVMTSKKKRR